MNSRKIANIENADIVKDRFNRQYHIGLAPGELAENIVLVGDPNRPEKAREFFTEISIDTKTREFRAITGKINDLEISVLSTGIGTDNTEICLVEIMQITNNPTIIRAGSCGGLQKFINIGDLIISTGAVRLENTSTFFVPEGYPAVANYEVILALNEAARDCQVTYHIGLTATASGFYGAQGRKIPGLPVRFPSLSDDLAKINVYNFEMETSTLLNLAQVLGMRAGVICAVFANRLTNKFISNEKKGEAENMVLKAALRAFQILQKMDQIKNQKNIPYWIPSLCLKDI